ncbi:penicillin-binding transpeptidase domain-containing protein, partial [Salmonella enterica]
ELQRYITDLLAGRKGAAVVLDPKDSSILAMVSVPSYDNNLFVDGISSNDYQRLLQDPQRPLYSRATQGAYPPASTV